MKKAVLFVLLGVVGGLLGAGVLLLATRMPAGEPVQLLPPPTNLPLAVYITGEVVSPGVYQLSPGSRVEDVIAVAGGLTEQANPESLNLAQIVSDGMRINVPGLVVPSPTTEGEDVPTRDLQLPTELINVNTATQEELESLPEIGPYLAGQIINYREVNGLFETIDELLDVPGIGPATLEAIRELVTVGD